MSFLFKTSTPTPDDGPRVLCSALVFPTPRSTSVQKSQSSLPFRLGSLDPTCFVVTLTRPVPRPSLGWGDVGSLGRWTLATVPVVRGTSFGNSRSADTVGSDAPWDGGFQGVSVKPLQRRSFQRYSTGRPTPLPQSGLVLRVQEHRRTETDSEQTMGWVYGLKFTDHCRILY